MPQLDEWLRSQGLGRCVPAFSGNDIDFDVLVELTDGDLQKLGLSLGHRRKLLRSIARWKQEHDERESGVAVSSPDHSPPNAGERRQVTVMFCDLVGSTALANQLDPEDMGVILHRFHGACSAAIAQFDGFVAKFMGDGVLAYFGYPQASEDAAENAIRAAIAMIEAMKRLATSKQDMLQVRIGIATGTVLIGDIIGEGPAREHSIVGETPNLAARLQALAEPDTILIGHNTHHLLGRRFEYLDLGEHSLKGFAAPVRVWRVLREAIAESRFATRAGADAAFVGRGDELDVMLAKWRLAAQSKGQALLISGEPGIGKSRLVDTLLERIGETPWRHVTCQCSPYHTNSALYPIIRYLERAAGFAADDTDDARLQKLEALLQTADAGRAALPVIAELLSLPTTRFPVLDVPPAQRKAATIGALAGFINRMAEESPVVLILEDAHWIDPTTRELWTRLIDEAATTRTLLLITARPEFTSTWPVGSVTALELSRLKPADSAELVRKAAAPRVLASALIDEVVAKADGIPLFVEELTKSVLESPLERPAVPATLHDSLMARLDRLGPARELAQVAAVIGQQFSQALLADVMSGTAEELASRIQQLVDAQLLFRQPRATEPTYSFKHALLRDVAYENLLRARRRQLHGRVAEALIAHFPLVVEAEPEVPAYHFGQAGEHARAATYRERAGDRAVARSSFIEALAQYDAALSEAARLPPGPSKTQGELEILLKSGPPLTIIKGPHSTDVGALYQRAHERAATVGGDIDMFKATWGLWYNTVTSRRLDLARDHAEALAALAARAGDDDLMLEGFHCRWSTAWFRGELDKCIAQSGEGVARYDRDKHRWMGPVFGGHDPGVCAHSVLGETYALTGEHAEAWRCAARALRLADDLGHPNSIGHALMTNCVTAQICHDYEALSRNSQQLLMLCEKYVLPPPKTHAMFLAGWMKAWTGDLAGGMMIMEAEYPRASAIGPFFCYYAALLAETFERADRVADAMTLLRSAIATIVEPGVGMYVSELYRLEGICLLRLDSANAEAAMHALQTAAAIARRQGATVLELSAVLGIARAAAPLDDSDPARPALAALCAALPPDATMPDLAAAKQLLSEFGTPLAHRSP